MLTGALGRLIIYLRKEDRSMENEQTNMDFEHAYLEMLHGNPVRRAGWKGYWKIDSTTGKLEIHLASGEVLTEGGYTSLTITETIGRDWEIVRDH
jgi:hypothetical protein